jgi:DNA repair protein RecO (recombination protein O)
MSGAGKGRVDGQPAYVLHTHPFRETSLIVEAFSRDHGRIALVARGARRPRSAMRGLLMAFQPLELGWFGQGEMRTLAKVEWVGGQPLLQAQALLLGYYMNELLLKLLPREDAHPALFQAYAEAVHALAAGEPSQTSLRRFEKTLLKELGYGLTLDREADSGRPVDPQKRYAYVLERGPVLLGAEAGEADAFSGRALLAIAQDDYSEAETLAQCKQLMRMLIHHYLGGQRLSSRRVFMELQEL